MSAEFREFIPEENVWGVFGRQDERQDVAGMPCGENGLHGEDMSNVLILPLPTGDFHEPDLSVEIRPSVERAGNGLIFVSCQDGDPMFADLTRDVSMGRQRRFKEENLLKATAPDTVDLGGENVEVLAILDTSKGFDPVAFLGKWHTSPGDGIEAMPSYVKAVKEGGFSEEGLKLLQLRSEGRPVVELIGLWKERGYDEIVKNTLYQKAFREAVTRNELWFMGVVTPEYNSLRRNFGSLVRTLGDPIPVRGEHASEHVRLHLVMMDPSTFIVDMVGEINTARYEHNPIRRLSREALLWYFLDGVENNELTSEALGLLEAA